MVSLAFVIYVPIALGYRLTEDFSHQERWGDDPQFDPRIYLPALGLAVTFAVVVLWRECRESYRQELRRRDRLSKLQSTAQK